jgi:hypothetical protein
LDSFEIAPSLQLLKKYHLEVLEVFLTAHFFHGGRVKADNAAGDEGAGSGAGRRHLEGVQRGWGFPSRALKGRRREREAITPLQGLRPEKEYSRTSSTQAVGLGFARPLLRGCGLQAETGFDLETPGQHTTRITRSRLFTSPATA